MARIYDALMSIHTAALSLGRRLNEQRGQDVIEYAVLAGFVGILLALALVLAPIGPNMDLMAGAIANCINITVDPYVCP